MIVSLWNLTRISAALLYRKASPISKRLEKVLTQISWLHEILRWNVLLHREYKAMKMCAVVSAVLCFGMGLHGHNWFSQIYPHRQGYIIVIEVAVRWSLDLTNTAKYARLTYPDLSINVFRPGEAMWHHRTIGMPRSQMHPDEFPMCSRWVFWRNRPAALGCPAGRRAKLGVGRGIGSF